MFEKKKNNIIKNFTTYKLQKSLHQWLYHPQWLLFQLKIRVLSTDRSNLFIFLKKKKKLNSKHTKNTINIKFILNTHMKKTLQVNERYLRLLQQNTLQCQHVLAIYDK